MRMFFTAFVSILVFTMCEEKQKETEIKDIDKKYSFDIDCLIPLDILNLESGNTYSNEDIAIKPLNENDCIEYSAPIFMQLFWVMKVKVTSYASDGLFTLQFLMEWYHPKIMTTDTITCEILKKGEIVKIKKIFFNGVLVDYDEEESGKIWVNKAHPAILDLFDKNRSHEPRVEVEDAVTGLKYVYWITDAEGRITNVFNYHDVNNKEKGFTVHLSITNTTSEPNTVSILSDYCVRGVYDIGHKFFGNFIGNCGFNGLIGVKLEPGETREAYVNWCYYIGDSNRPPEGNISLPTGKYYIYSYGRITTASNGDLEVARMILDFEIK